MCLLPMVVVRRSPEVAFVFLVEPIRNDTRGEVVEGTSSALALASA